MKPRTLKQYVVDIEVYMLLSLEHSCQLQFPYLSEIKQNLKSCD